MFYFNEKGESTFDVSHIYKKNGVFIKKMECHK